MPGTSGFQKFVSRPAVPGAALIAAFAGAGEIREMRNSKKAKGSGPIGSIFRKVNGLKDRYRSRVASNELKQAIEDLAALDLLREEKMINDEERATMRQLRLDNLFGARPR
jgi:hypothetical protein